MSAIIDSAFAREFAAEWVAAWNSGDLERIFSHYVDDFEMRSPLIAERGFSPTGALRGKSAIRPYWGGGIQKRSPLVQPWEIAESVPSTFAPIRRESEIVEMRLDGLAAFCGGSRSSAR